MIGIAIEHEYRSITKIEIPNKIANAAFLGVVPFIINYPQKKYPTWI